MNLTLLKERINLIKEGSRKGRNSLSPFWVIVQKEFSDHLRSWRYAILLLIILLTCFGSLYTAMISIRDAVLQEEMESQFLFLKLFTISDGTLPSFITFIGFLGPLLGISLGFDAVNSERNKGTLSRLLAQPVPRDNVISAKFTAALLVISLLFFALGFLVMGISLIMIGIPPTAEEFLRLLSFILVSIIFVSFWLALAILFSVKFRQAATSALASIAIWLFFSLFFIFIVNLVMNGFSTFFQVEQGSFEWNRWEIMLHRFSPIQLFSESTTVLLVPEMRFLNPVTVEQVYGSIPTPLPLSQSLLIIWPQLTALLSGAMICFAFAYWTFMREEIRSR